MRRFQLVRTIDHTGVSGTGVVAEGVEFTDRTTVVHWVVEGRPRSTVVYRNVMAVQEIHNHENTANAGGTELIFLD